MQQEQKDKMKYHDFTSKYKREEKEKKPVAKKFYFKERRLVLVECIPTVYTLMLYEYHEKPARPSSRTIYKWKKNHLIFERNSVVFFHWAKRKMRQKLVALQPPDSMMMNVLRWMEKIGKNIWCLWKRRQHLLQESPPYREPLLLLFRVIVVTQKKIVGFASLLN